MGLFQSNNIIIDRCLFGMTAIGSSLFVNTISKGTYLLRPLFAPSFFPFSLLSCISSLVSLHLFLLFPIPCFCSGVWRVKWHPHFPDLLVTACMHNGFHVLRLDAAQQALHRESSFYHESLAYGVDWNPAVGSAVVAACSFYDRLLKLWEVEL